MNLSNLEVESMCLRIAKDNFKFSSAHMSYLSSTDKEALHGHNYYVQCSFKISPKLSRQFVDFSVLKSCIRRICKLWDEKILIPNVAETLQHSADSHQIQLKTHDKTYSFPESEVLILNTPNIILENLSLLFLETLISDLKDLKLYNPSSGPIFKVMLSMEETRGQSVEVST
jgi:6-pyruvoyl-tetrahydropterin synthase